MSHDPIELDERERAFQETGASAAASIVEMVAALQCNYNRLSELRDERDDWDEHENDMTWHATNPDDAIELAELEAATGECENDDDARERILEDALSIEVRSGWQSLGETLVAEEFRIVLTTGGPHVEILGELNEHDEPSRAWLMVQDWFTPKRQFFGIESETLLAYARCFYFNA